MSDPLSGVTVKATRWPDGTTTVEQVQAVYAAYEHVRCYDAKDYEGRKAIVAPLIEAVLGGRSLAEAYVRGHWDGLHCDANSGAFGTLDECDHVGRIYEPKDAAGAASAPVFPGLRPAASDPIEAAFLSGWDAGYRLAERRAILETTPDALDALAATPADETPAPAPQPDTTGEER